MKIIEKIVNSVKDKYNHPMPSIAFLGDSVTEGIFKIREDYKSSYPYKVKNLLYNIFPSANVNIINAGIGGTNALLGAERLERDVLSKNPDLCVVCFGLNDSLAGPAKLSEYTDALSEIFERLQKNGVEIIFMTPNMMCTYFDKELVPSIYAPEIDGFINVQNSGILDMYMDAAREVCVKHNVPLCDCYAKWKVMCENGVDTTKLLANGINHPTPELHDLFAASLVETMFK